MVSNFNKAERYVKQGDEYKLLSYATSSESVEMTDGESLQTKMDNIDVDLTSHTTDKSNPHEVTKTQVGLSNVDNTADADKPVSTATQTALDKKANLASPTLTGTPKAPTASTGTNTTQIATTAFVQTAVANLVDSAPETLNTLGELATAIEEHQDVTDALDAAISNKVDKVSGKGLSTNDYTTNEKNKLSATNVAYGTCATEAATVEKVITISGNTDWALKAGSVITVKFTYTNTASNPTFNVNNTGAKKVWYNTALITTTNLGFAGTANRPMNFVYDGTQYIFIGWSYDKDANTTYTNASLGQGYGTCATAASTTAKVVTLSSYALTTGGVVAVKFTYAVPANATMNVNSKGAKYIYYRGAKITAGIIEAGDTATFIYDGTQYHLLAVDRHPAITKSTDSTSTASPSAGGTFTAIDSVTRDDNGHVTKVNTKTVTLPSTSITVDSALSSTSTNPVQNKVINSALSGKVNTSSVLSTVEECTASTTATDVASASALSALNDSLTYKPGDSFETYGQFAGCTNTNGVYFTIILDKPMAYGTNATIALIGSNFSVYTTSGATTYTKTINIFWERSYGNTLYCISNIGSLGSAACTVDGHFKVTFS